MTTSFSIRNCLLIFLTTGLLSAIPAGKLKNLPVAHADRTWTASERLSNSLQCFNPVNNTAAFSISICADVPDDQRPDKVFFHKEPGHVFLILEKKDSLTVGNKPVSLVFGFYPRRPVSSIVFKNVRCEILDNSNREYNASLTKKLTAEEFQLVLQKAEELAKKKYNINRYNCYDYAIGVFNTVPGIEKLQVRHIKFPLIFGRGGSPCGLYRDLEKLKADGSAWAPFITIGKFTAPSGFINTQH